MVNPDKFTKKEKLQVVRDLMAGDPNCLDYGYLQVILKHFRRKYRMDIDESYVSKLRKEVIEEWARTKTAEHSKGHLLSVWAKLFKKLKNENSKIRILTEIGRLNGHYIERHEVATPDIEAAGKKLDELFKGAHGNTPDKE